jgi:katanin p60 ATPase-containing subunit A1
MTDIENLPNVVKLARENAILGNYDDSIKHYQDGLNTIQSFLTVHATKATKEQWKFVESVILQELTNVKEIIEINESFTNNFGAGPKNGPSNGMRRIKTNAENLPVEIVTPEQSYMMKPPIPLPVAKKQPSFERFGGAEPFGHHKSGPDQYYGKDIDDYADDGKNYFVNQRNPKYFQEEKDPEIWDPPSPPRYENYRKRQPTKWNSNKRKQVKRVASQKRPPMPPPAAGPKKMPQVEERKRNYDKPWASGASKAPKGSSSKDTDSFLYHCYPDGVGPDTELINMLEKDVLDKNPQVSFDDIADLDDAKNTLQEAVLLPILMPQYFKGIRRPWKGVLLFGPPGTGKTMLAKAVATQGKTTFFNVSASSLASKWRGESEKLVRILFEMARFYAPSVIFMDEVDSIASKRSSNEHESNRKVKSELLIQMDGVAINTSAGGDEKMDESERGKTVLVLAATNRPWDLDEAIRRRLEKRIYIPLPTAEGIKQLLEINMKGLKKADDINVSELVKKTKGFSGADIAILCREAAMMPMRRKLTHGKINFEELAKIEKELDVPITMSDFKEALKNISKSVSKDNLTDYAKWMEEFGCK